MEFLDDCFPIPQTGGYFLQLRTFEKVIGKKLAGGSLKHFFLDRNDLNLSSFCAGKYATGIISANHRYLFPISPGMQGVMSQGF